MLEKTEGARNTPMLSHQKRSPFISANVGAFRKFCPATSIEVGLTNPCFRGERLKPANLLALMSILVLTHAYPKKRLNAEAKKCFISHFDIE